MVDPCLATRAGWKRVNLIARTGYNENSAGEKEDQTEQRERRATASSTVVEEAHMSYSVVSEAVHYCFYLDREEEVCHHLSSVLSSDCLWAIKQGLLGLKSSQNWRKRSLGSEGAMNVIARF
jgi:hypothetical protein